MERVESKIRAKELLNGRWANAVGATALFCIVPWFISFIMSFLIPLIGGIVGSLFVMYMILCLTKYCIKLTEEEGRIKYGECFLDALTFFKMLGAEILVSIIMFLIPVIIIMVGSIIMITSSYLIGSIILTLGMIIAVVLSILYTLIFFTLPFIFIENDEVGVIEAIKRAMAISKGFKWKYFVFLLSFIGWGILATLSLAIGWLWLRPYLILSTFLFYKHMNGEYKNVDLFRN